MKNRQIPGRLSAFLADQHGTVGIVIALLLPLLFGFAGLAVDIGYIYEVNSQLKNASDAGALAGARGLVPYIQSTEAGIIVYKPDWLNGTGKAQNAVNLNHAYADKDTGTVLLPLAVSTASPGSEVPPLSGGPLLSQATPCYWNLNSKTMKSTAATPETGDVPAMLVTVSKTAGQNEGPVKRYLAPLLNIIPGVFLAPTADTSATSVAMISFNTGMPPSSFIKPMVATKTIIDKYWEKYDPLNPTVPFQFKLGDGSQAEDTMWSSFKVDDNSDAYTKQLINQGNPDPLKIDDMIHLQPGARAVDYGPNEMGQFINQTVVLPIVDVPPGELTTNTEKPILGFIPFHITGYNQGGKYIEGYFDKTVISNPYQDITGLPGSTAPTIFNPPQLVN
jgi:hypothetical protein